MNNSDLLATKARVQAQYVGLFMETIRFHKDANAFQLALQKVFSDAFDAGCMAAEGKEVTFERTT